MIDMKEHDEAQRKRALHQHFENFLRKWAPRNRDSREFEADLFMLTRAIHEDAARPFGAMLEKSLMAMPPFHMVLEKDKTDG